MSRFRVAGGPVSRVLPLLGTVVMALMVAACKPSVPDEFIQPGKMENILHDYYLARAMSDMDSQPASLITYKTAVLRKYGVSEAEFNASLAYYSRHADRLHDIYESLSDRLSQESVALGGTAGESAADSFAASGDTANIWRGARALMLLPYKPQNFFTYTVPRDTSFRRGDAFMLRFRTDWLSQDGSREAVALLKVRFTGDSVALRTVRIYGSSPYSASVEDAAGVGVEEISGYFLLNNSLAPSVPRAGVQVLVVSGIELIRMRHRPAATTPADPLAAKSASGAAPASSPRRTDSVGTTAAPRPLRTGGVIRHVEGKVK